MKNNILLIIVLLANLSAFSQVECDQFKEGVKYINENIRNKAVEFFEAKKQVITRDDNCYVQLNFLLGKSHYLNNGSEKTISKYLQKAFAENSIDALEFYALEMSEHYSFYLFRKIDIKSFVNLDTDGSLLFFIGNIYSKNPETRHSNLPLDYFISALKKGYSDPRIFTENYITKHMSEAKSKLYYSSIEKHIPDEELKHKIKVYIEPLINEWQKKGKFEKTATFQKRVNEENRLIKVEELTQNYINNEGRKFCGFSNAKNEYDADNEVFKISLSNNKLIYLPVPLREAETFDRNFQKIQYVNPEFTYSKGEYEVLNIEAINPANGKRYIYKSDKLVAFNTSTLKLNFEDVDITLNSKDFNADIHESNTVINVGKSDVDENVPVNKYTDENKYALIIGNEDYTKYQSGLNSESNVDFANKDAVSFANYCIKTLGVPESNVVILEDAISSQMNREIEKLMKLAKYSNGQAELIFYYAGHGFPDEITKESYLMPVDISGADVTSGIQLTELYSKLSLYPTKKVTIFLDACFSGSGRNEGLLAARGIKVVPKEEKIIGNLIVFSASSGSQSSLPYIEKQHGLFTYFLLKKLKESNGEVTYGELSDYIKSNVELNSIKINSKDQNPQTLYSPEIKENWQNWKFTGTK